MSILSVSGLSKAYSSPSGNLEILRAVDLQFEPGDSVAILGPSGSGKSTLLSILGLLESPTAGTVELGGVTPHQLAPAEQANFRGEHVGFIFQDHHLLPQCTVLENVLIPTMARPARSSDAVARARVLLERVGLKDRLHHRPAQLSGGERQRVAVCRALINQPDLLLADEPTGNLDRQTAETVGSLLLELAQEQQSILLCVTHSQDLAARFQRRLALNNGQLEAA